MIIWEKTAIIFDSFFIVMFGGDINHNHAFRKAKLGRKVIWLRIERIAIPHKLFLCKPGR